MRNVRKINIIRAGMIGVILMLGGSFAYAVYQDRSTGTLMDEQGIVDKDFVR